MSNPSVLLAGPIADTEGTARLLPGGISKDERAAAIPVQRYGKTDDIANATIYLFSPAASYVRPSSLLVYHVQNQLTLIAFRR